MSSPEVVGDDRQAATRRAVLVIRMEGKSDGGTRLRVNRDSDVLRDGRRGKWDPALRDGSQNDAGIGAGINRLQIDDALRQRDRGPHRGVEQLLLRCEVTQDSRRRDAELAGDVGESRGAEARRGEAAPAGVEDLVAGDGRWAAHL